MYIRTIHERRGYKKRFEGILINYTVAIDHACTKMGGGYVCNHGDLEVIMDPSILVVKCTRLLVRGSIHETKSGIKSGLLLI